MRTFIAVPVEPSHELRQLMVRLKLMRQFVKPTDSAQLHITLKFLGDITEQNVAEVVQGMQEACANSSATTITLRGLGVFPDHGRPAVLWAGIAEGEALIAMEESLSSHLETIGYPREQRAYHPHLTLARIKAQPPREFFGLLDEHAADGAGPGTFWGICPVDRVVLYESQRTARGYRHVPLATQVLKPNLLLNLDDLWYD